MEFKETERVELKREFDKDNRETVEKEIVAFLNTSGGIIYIGVDDDGTVVGVDRPDNVFRWLSDIVLRAISPECGDYVALSMIDAEGKKVVEIDIIKGESLYYISRYGRSTKGCFVRVGTACQSLSEREIQIIQDKCQKVGKSITNIPVKTKRMTFERLKYWYSAKGLSVSDKWFEQNAHLRTNGEYNILASLLADENDVSIKVVHFDGDDKGAEILLRNEFGYKCLIDAMNDALRYCVNVVDVTQCVIHRDGIRADVKIFNGDAFRELWVNACIHNDWIDGTPPAIYVFKNHIEIISTGGLPYNMTKEDFFGGISRPVNESLEELFIQLGIIEQSGHGIRDVLKVYDESIFTFMDNFIRVEIPYTRPDYTDTWEHEDEMRKNGSYYDKSDIIFFDDDVKDGKSDTINGKSVVVNCENDTVNAESDTINGGSVVVNGGSDTVNGKSVVANGKSGTVYDKSVVVSGRSDTINEERDVINGECGTVNCKSIVVNGRSGTINEERDVINGECGTVKNADGSRLSYNVDELDKRILVAIESDNTYSANVLGELTSTSYRTVQRALKRLTDGGYVRREGSDKNGHWIILKMK